MKAVVKTKSNFRNLNGQALEVHEIAGNRVSCIVYDELAYNGRLITDFTLKEVERFIK
jgi:hypothetical protein